MSINIERRLQRISEALSRGHSLLQDMTDDELARVITGSTKAKASDITDEQLKATINGRSANETGTPITMP